MFVCCDCCQISLQRDSSSGHRQVKHGNITCFCLHVSCLWKHPAQIQHQVLTTKKPFASRVEFGCQQLNLGSLEDYPVLLNQQSSLSPSHKVRNTPHRSVVNIPFCAIITTRPPPLHTARGRHLNKDPFTMAIWEEKKISI